jgi:hypothetical protein
MPAGLARSSRTAILAVSIALAIIFVAFTALQVAPYEQRGFEFDGVTGRVTGVDVGSPAWTAGVRRGDTLLDPPRGDFRRGFRLDFPVAADRFRIRTQRGIVAVAPMRYVPLDDPDHAYVWVDMAADISVVVVLGFATLLYVRRPGPMAFSFWLYAASSWSLGQFGPLFAHIARNIAVLIVLPISAVIGSAFAFPLIPFALRFPDDRVSARGARWERVAWIGYGIAVVAGMWYYAVGTFGRILPAPIGSAILFSVPALPLPIAAAILIAGYLRADQQRRAQAAWAVSGFAGALLFTFLAQNEAALSGLAIVDIATIEFFYAAISVVGNLLPLLAIYPILRFRLFDIGFVFSRATLYSVLTVAAFATLAGVNWIAQRVVNDRIATVAQPIAAIVIGLGYFRVRQWIKDLIERVLFRDRLATEREIDALIATLPSTRSLATIDEALTVAAAHTLSLQSAALFRGDESVLDRTAAVGWEGASLEHLRSGDTLLAALESGQRIVSLRALEWDAPGEPAEPARPVTAIALRHGDALLGVGLYGRHVNGTEIDPEEMTMLRRLCDAASTAYDSAALRATIAELQSQLTSRSSTPL